MHMKAMYVIIYKNQFVPQRVFNSSTFQAQTAQVSMADEHNSSPDAIGKASTRATTKL